MRALALLALAGYRRTLAPLLGALGFACRHEPSCSHYASEAIARHGLVRGGVLALGRLLRCQPWGTSGFDPVPDVAHAPHAGVARDASRRAQAPPATERA